MQILIATPTYGGVTTEYVASTMKLQAYLTGRGVGVRTAYHSMTEVARSRNMLASLFLAQKDMTHLLFVDSDMNFEPGVVQALIDADKPLIGCVYPRRSLDIDRLMQAARDGADRPRALAAAMDFVIKPLGDGIGLDGGRGLVRGIGMGLCLIAREVFEQLRDTGQLKRNETMAAGRPVDGAVHGFFDPLPADDGFLAEDLSFCERWIALCGGEVWAMVDQDIGHVGTMEFRARFSDALRPA